jgi:transcriptional regulator with XRE-family HTH domain
MGFWKRVKEEIKSQGTTQSWVASRVPIGPEKFSRWIANDVIPNAVQSVSIAKALGVTVEYLVDGDSVLCEKVATYGYFNPTIKKITDDLAFLSESELQLIAVQVAALATGAKARQANQA